MQRFLTELLGQQVKFIDDVCGPAARKAIADLQEGEILLLDNVRFVSEEQTLFELKLNLSHEEQAQTLMVRKLALWVIFMCAMRLPPHTVISRRCAVLNR